MDKSPEAFRTISEVAEALETPAHVLRFWESRFPQIRPVKRAGGRRYYRPSDVALLSGIRHLLHDQGMTIRGVQKVLREQGVRHVASLMSGAALPEEDDAALEASLRATQAKTRTGAESAEILALPEMPPPRSPSAQAGDAAQAEVLQLHNPATPPGAGRSRQTDIVQGDEVDRSVQGAGPTVDDLPEAGHIWVEDEAEPELNLGFTPHQGSEAPRPPIPLNRRTTALQPPARPATGGGAAGTMFDDLFSDDGEARGDAMKLSGLAARIRALPRPLSPEALLDLTELHSRLGLLHAQIAEALNSRR